MSREDAEKQFQKRQEAIDAEKQEGKSEEEIVIPETTEPETVEVKGESVAEKKARLRELDAKKIDLLKQRADKEAEAEKIREDESLGDKEKRKSLGGVSKALDGLNKEIKKLSKATKKLVGELRYSGEEVQELSSETALVGVPKNPLAPFDTKLAGAAPAEIVEAPHDLVAPENKSKSVVNPKEEETAVSREMENYISTDLEGLTEEELKDLEKKLSTHTYRAISIDLRNRAEKKLKEVRGVKMWMLKQKKQNADGGEKAPEPAEKDAHEPGRRTQSMSEAFAQAEKGREEAKKERRFSPEGVASDFIKDFGLGEMLPEGFDKLSPEVKYVVVRQLKQRIIDIVKSDAETKYSDDFKNKLEGTTNKFKKVFAGVENRIKKAAILKANEVQLFNDLRDTDAGRKIVAENFSLLTSRLAGQEVVLDSAGTPTISYLKPEDIAGVSPIQMERLKDFNEVATKFAYMPYEWGQQKSGGKRRDYDIVKREFERIRERMFLIMQQKEKNPGQAAADMIRVENFLKMEQLINTHPEVDTVFGDLGSDPTRMGNIWKTLKDFGKGATGEKGEYLGLGVLGGGLRWGARGAAALTAMTGLTLVAAPVIGGVIGRMRGGMRAKDTIEARKRGARHGTKTSIGKEGVSSTTAQRLTERLEKIIKELDNSDTTPERKAEVVALLQARIEHTIGKIEKGEVNFGDAQSALINQFNLTNKLNEALVLNAALAPEADKAISAEIEKWLKMYGAQREEVMSESQQKYIKEQMKKGMKYGAGFATAGYFVRWLWEIRGDLNVSDIKDWLGGGETGIPHSPGLPSGGVSDATNVLPRGVGGGHLDNLTTVPFKPQGPDLPEGYVPPIQAPEIGMMHSVESPVHEFDAQAIHEKISGAPLDENAIIHQGEGIEHAIRRQIEADPEKYGFHGNVNDHEAVHSFSGPKAHEITKANGYVDGPKEVRVRVADKVAYQLEKGPNGEDKIFERMVGQSDRVETHSPGQPFETDTEKYEYIKTVKRALKEAYDTEHQVSPPPKMDVPEIQIPPETHIPDVHHGHGVEKGIGKGWEHQHDKHLDHMPTKEYSGHGVSGRGGRILGPEDFADHQAVAPQPIPDRFPATGQNVIYDSQRGIIPLADPNGPIGVASPQEIIEAAFAGAPVHLPDEVTERIYMKTVDAIYADWFAEGDSEASRNVVNEVLNYSAKNLVVDELKYGGDKLNTPVFEFITKTKEVLGIEPNGAGFFRKAESVSDFIKRAIETAAEKGRLSKLLG